ncbi:hypothetical protein [Rhodococcus chondri]|uniref:Uncharacterized protein n=1 Tax=Rhodococcus chondri TaxID=3065941 RepID=A0ABU7JRV7_9NOCA|nr:hypothetical protein [Rhodococcus sp. CC-R104]MEE2032758.1 hypothetical protein [Rhodococcus sp. CC-R104]
MSNNSGPSSSGELTVGTRVTVRIDEEKNRLAGVVVEDFANEAAKAGGQLGRDWAPVRRWGVALDDGRLVFSDDIAVEQKKA